MAGWANRIDQRQQVSLSQSGVMLTTLRKLPDVSPWSTDAVWSANKGHFAGFFGFRQRILIHIAQHQHFTRNGVLHDDRHQTVGFCQSSCSLNIP